MPKSKTKAELQSELDEVKKKAAQLEKVIESLDVSLCRWLPDTTLTHANQKYKGIFGITGQAEGKQWLDFLPEESRASTAAFYDEVTKKPHVVSYEHPVTVEDGSIRHYQWFDTPLLDANGTVTEYQSIGIDITERKLSENELIAKEKKLKSLIDSQSHFMIRVNMAGKYSYWNAQFEKEFGWLYEPQGIQNSDVMIAICEYHRQRVREVVEQCVAQPGVVFSVEVDKPARDGGVRTTLWEFVCLTDDQNQPVEVQCMGIELTGRKNSERLVTAQRDLARLAALGKPEEEIWAACFQAAAVVSELDCGGLYLFNKNTRAFELVYHTGLSAEFVKAVASFAEDTPTAQLVLNGRTTYLNEADLKARSYNDTERLRAAAILPINHRGQVLGCLNISSRLRAAVSEQARYALETIVTEIGNLLVYQQTETELEISHIQLRQTLLAARMGAWRFDVSTTRMHWSPEAAQLLGTEDQEEDAEKVLQYLYPEDRGRMLQVIQDTLTQKTTWNFEYRILNTAGEMMWVTSFGKVECDHDGNPIAISGLMQDVTEQRRVLEELRASEEKYRGLIKSLTNAISVIDLNGNFLYMNDTAAADFDRTSQDVVGRNMHELFPEPFASLQMDYVQKVFEVDQEIVYEAKSMVKKGLRWFRVSFQPLHDDNGVVAQVLISATDIHDLKVAQQELQDLNHTLEEKVAHVRDANGKIILIQSVVRDIAERKAVEETLRLSRDQLRTANTALQKASQAKNEFLANMSHELRTPLNGILGMAEILLEEIRGPLNERQRKMVEVIETSGQHLLSLINDILDLSKIEAGKLELNVEEIYVADICQTSLSFIKEPAMKKDIRVALELNPQVVTIRADMRRIKQILINLLSNAVKFTLPKGNITLRVENDAEREFVHFSVIDTGIGISDEDMKKLFTPFTQVDSSLTREYEGTGLGLALVMELAELHGGSVKVESTVGQGSTFTVTIPWNRKPEHETISIGDSMMQQPNNQIPEENSNTPKFVSSQKFGGRVSQAHEPLRLSS